MSGGRHPRASSPGGVGEGVPIPWRQTLVIFFSQQSQIQHQDPYQQQGLKQKKKKKKAISQLHSGLFYGTSGLVDFIIIILE